MFVGKIKIILYKAVSNLTEYKMGKAIQQQLCLFITLLQRNMAAERPARPDILCPIDTWRLRSG